MERLHRRLSRELDGPAVTPVLFTIILVALVLRLGVALVHGNTVEPLPGIHDQLSYDALARRVLTGHGFTFSTDWWPATAAGEPTAHWSYLYTIYLAVVYAITGVSPLAARLIQALIAGLVQPWLTWRIGRRLFGAPVGVVAALLTAGYGYFVYYAGALMTETFYILSLLWLLDIATNHFSVPATVIRLSQARVAPHRSGRLAPWMLLGAALGTAALLRQVILIFLPVLLLWLLWTHWQARRMLWQREALSPTGKSTGGWQTMAAGLFAMLAMIALMILPWTARNYRAFDDFVLLNTNAGYAFFWANHPIHGNQFIPILPSRTYREMIPVELRGLDEPALDRALLQRGVQLVLTDPRRYALLSISRLAEYFKFWPSADSSLASNITRVGSFGLLLPFMLYGLVMAALQRRQIGNWWQNSSVLLLYLFILVYTLIHLLSWTLIRYRLPVDAVLLIFAAVGMVSLLAWVTGHGVAEGARNRSRKGDG